MDKLYQVVEACLREVDVLAHFTMVHDSNDKEWPSLFLFGGQLGSGHCPLFTLEIENGTALKVSPYHENDEWDHYNDIIRRNTNHETFTYDLADPDCWQKIKGYIGDKRWLKKKDK
jgi:hypothetical protein